MPNIHTYPLAIINNITQLNFVMLCLFDILIINYDIIISKLCGNFIKKNYKNLIWSKITYFVRLFLVYAVPL